MIIPKQVYSHRQLLSQGYGKKEIERMSASLRLFPTPFKGIYYAPPESERKSWTIEWPMKILSMAVSLYLDSMDFYFTGVTSQEAFGEKWHATGIVHIVNAKISRKIDLKSRAERNLRKKSYRSQKIADLLSFYGNILAFHKVKTIRGAKLRRTPSGDFASRSQIKKDVKMFGEAIVSEAYAGPAK